MLYTDIAYAAAVEKSLRLLQAFVQIAAGTTSSATDAKTWNMARGQFALGKIFSHLQPSPLYDSRRNKLGFKITMITLIALWSLKPSRELLSNYRI